MMTTKTMSLQELLRQVDSRVVIHHYGGSTNEGVLSCGEYTAVVKWEISGNAGITRTGETHVVYDDIVGFDILT